MAKNVTHSIHVRVPRPKTPAQKQRAADNIRAAAMRLKRLQERQALVKEARKAGFVGTDDQVIAKYELAKQEAELQAKLAEERAEHAAYVQSILSASGAYRKRIEGFLADRINREPSFVREKLNDFFSRPRNADVKAYVDKVLSLREVK